MSNRVASRCPCRPMAPAAFISLSTSSGVRCSRDRRLAFIWRAGGLTFPFMMVGRVPLSDPAFLLAAIRTLPYRHNNGKVFLAGMLLANDGVWRGPVTRERRPKGNDAPHVGLN